MAAHAINEENKVASSMSRGPAIGAPVPDLLGARVGIQSTPSESSTLDTDIPPPTNDPEAAEVPAPKPQVPAQPATSEAEVGASGPDAAEATGGVKVDGSVPKAVVLPVVPLEMGLVPPPSVLASSLKATADAAKPNDEGHEARQNKKTRLAMDSAVASPP